MKFSLILSCALLMMTFPVFAEESDRLTWSGSIQIERDYDSSVSLEQIDRVSRESDYASQVKWEAGGKWQATESMQFSASYHGRHRAYDEFSEFDLDQHHLAFSSKYTFAGIGYSYRYDHAIAKVDGDSFLSFSQSTLAIDKLFKSRYFLRAAVSTNKKDFAQLNERNAKANSVAIDSLVFFNRGNSHLGFNISLEDETAQASLYDNTTVNLGLAYQYKFSEVLFPTSLIFGFKYERKDYDAFVVNDTNNGGVLLIEPDSSEMRVDKRKQWSTGFEIELNAWLELSVKADYIDNVSNYALVDQSEHSMSLGIKVSF